MIRAKYNKCLESMHCLAGLANLRKTKRECSHITRVLTHITKKWDEQNNTEQSLLKPILRCSSQAQRIEI